MNTDLTPTYRPEIRSYRDNRVIAYADIVVKTDDYKVLQTFPSDREGYRYACRFVRLIERGYSPDAASWMVYLDPSTYSSFKLSFVPSLHDKLTDEPCGCYPVDFAPAVEADWLTESYMTEYGIEPGEEISLDDLYYYYCMNFADDKPLPRYLTGVAQLQDEEQNFVHSHHYGFIPY